MVNNKNLIKCPQCGHEFPVEEALSHQAEERLRKEYEDKSAGQKRDFEAKLKAEREKLTVETVQKTREEFEAKLKSLAEENDKRKKENMELRQKEVALLKRENEIEEKESDLKLKMEKDLFERQNEIENKARAKERESFELERVKLIKQIEDNKKLAEEMKKRAEQGSMEMQGEVQEIALKSFLEQEYPFDLIADVPKGVKGADIIQTVKNKLNQECGIIVYESKRTKSFSGGWISKLKNDQREINANIAVIVTETMPKDMARFGKKENVWICTYQELKGLSFALRETLIQVHAAGAVEENKTDKMAVLYGYLTSPDFSRRIEAIVEGFSELKSGIDVEKRAMQKIWKVREKQIEKVITNTIDMYGSIKGIAGNAVGAVKALELPEPDDTSVDEENSD